MDRRRWLSGCAAACVALFALPAWSAEGVTATLEVDRTQLTVGESLIVTLEVTAHGQGRPPEPEIPAEWTRNFEVTGVERSHRSQRVFNGSTFTSTASYVLSAVLVPRKTGSHTLSFAVEAPGGTVRSNAVAVEVGEAEIPTPGSRPTSADKEVFLWATLDKHRAYVGEQLTYTLEVYERRRFLDVRLRTPPGFSDFFTEELAEGEVRIESVAGVPYRVHPGLRRALFPQEAGTLSVGAAEVAVGLRQVERSAPLTVEVLPLPARGRPPGLSPNNVGVYTIAAEVDANEVDVGQPLTLRVTIEGDGNIEMIEPPVWPEIEGVRRYDPKIETDTRTMPKVGGKRVYSFLLIPERSGSVAIEPIAFSFFDPEEAAYRTVKTEPLSLQVRGDATQAVAPEANEAKDEGEPLAGIIAAPSVPRVAPRKRWLTPERWTYAMVAVPLTALAGFGASALWRRSRPDDKARARSRRRLRQRNLLEAARSSVHTGKGFYVHLGQLLQEVALARAGDEGAGLPRKQLLALLAEQGIPQAELRRLEALLERCDAARFGALTDDEAQRRALLQETTQVVDAFSKG